MAISSERAAAAGLRSIFVGFETLSPGNLARSNKRQNLGRDYAAVTDRLHGLGIMINGSFVFGMDDDDENVFQRTVDWAVKHGITTATFHIQTPYPGTRLFARTEGDGRILTRDWDLYDTRHVVYRPARLTPEALKAGYDWAYREFYRWSSIAQASLSHGSVKHKAKHFFYAAGWKKFEPLWDLVIRATQLHAMTPFLEGVLSKVTAKCLRAALCRTRQNSGIGSEQDSRTNRLSPSVNVSICRCRKRRSSFMCPSEPSRDAGTAGNLTPTNRIASTAWHASQRKRWRRWARKRRRRRGSDDPIGH